jgi:hypothetical protein
MDWILVLNIIFEILLCVLMSIQCIIMIYKFFISKKEITGKELIIVMILNIISIMFSYFTHINGS